MTDIRPKNLPAVTMPTAGDKITLDGATTRSITHEDLAGSGALKSNAQAIGYTTGAGGAVTQATNKLTGVTLNKASGAITLNGAALASATNVGFTLTNSMIAAADTVHVQLKSGHLNDATYQVWAESAAAGSCKVIVRNISGGSLAEALVLQFNVIKGAVA